jgi:hypothetical protein
MTSMQGTRVRLASAALAVGVLVVTGCSQNSPGVAAYVGDEQITDTELTEAVEGVNEAIGEESPVPRQDIITAMVLGEVSAQIAARKNIPLTDEKRAAQTNPVLLAFPEAKAVAFDLADSRIVQETLGTEAFVAEIQATPVTVNPRYGVWNPRAVGQPILNGELGSLSQPGSAQSP